MAFVAVDVGRRVLDGRRKKRASAQVLLCHLSDTLFTGHNALAVLSCLFADATERASGGAGAAEGAQGRRWPLYLPLQGPSRAWPHQAHSAGRPCLTWSIQAVLIATILSGVPATACINSTGVAGRACNALDFGKAAEMCQHQNQVQTSTTRMPGWRLRRCAAQCSAWRL